MSKLKNYVAAERDTEEQQPWGNEFRWEVAPHNIVEEHIFSTSFREYLGTDGQKPSDEDGTQHQQVNCIAASLNFSPICEMFLLQLDEKTFTFAANVIVIG